MRPLALESILFFPLPRQIEFPQLQTSSGSLFSICQIVCCLVLCFAHAHACAHGRVGYIDAHLHMYMYAYDDHMHARAQRQLYVRVQLWLVQTRQQLEHEFNRLKP
jgi:hypothetical protein